MYTKRVLDCLMQQNLYHAYSLCWDQRKMPPMWTCQTPAQTQHKPIPLQPCQSLKIYIKPTVTQQTSQYGCRSSPVRCTDVSNRTFSAAAYFRWGLLTSTA